jgi:hypothetical protein
MCPFRNFFDVLNEDDSTLTKPIDDMRVVDNLVTDVDGRAVLLHGLFDNRDGAVHPSTETAWAGQNEFQVFGS